MPWRDILFLILQFEFDNLNDFVETLVKLALVNKMFAQSISLYWRDLEQARKLYSRFCLKSSNPVTDFFYDFGSRAYLNRECSSSLWREQIGSTKMHYSEGEERRFVKLVKKSLILGFSPFCSVCHTNMRSKKYPRDMLTSVWMLGMRICKICAPRCFISSKKLYKMGLRLDVEVSPNTYLLEKLAGKVFMVRLEKNSWYLKKFTHDDVDEVAHMNYAKQRSIVFWKRDLEKYIDFGKVWESFAEKMGAGKVIWGFAQRLRIQTKLRKGRGFQSMTENNMTSINFVLMSQEAQNMFLLHIDEQFMNKESSKAEKMDIGSCLQKRGAKWNRKLNHIWKLYNNSGDKILPSRSMTKKFHEECVDELAMSGESFDAKSFAVEFEKLMQKKIVKYQEETFAIC